MTGSFHIFCPLYNLSTW